MTTGTTTRGDFNSQRDILAAIERFCRDDIRTGAAPASSHRRYGSGKFMTHCCGWTQRR